MCVWGGGVLSSSLDSSPVPFCPLTHPFLFIPFLAFGSSVCLLSRRISLLTRGDSQRTRRRGRPRSHDKNRKVLLHGCTDAARLGALREGAGQLFVLFFCVPVPPQHGTEKLVLFRSHSTTEPLAHALERGVCVSGRSYRVFLSCSFLSPYSGICSVSRGLFRGQRRKRKASLLLPQGGEEEETVSAFTVMEKRRMELSWKSDQGQRVRRRVVRKASRGVYLHFAQEGICLCVHLERKEAGSKTRKRKTKRRRPFPTAGEQKKLATRC